MSSFTTLVSLFAALLGPSFGSTAEGGAGGEAGGGFLFES